SPSLPLPPVPSPPGLSALPRSSATCWSLGPAWHPNNRRDETINEARVMLALIATAMPVVTRHQLREIPRRPAATREVRPPHLLSSSYKAGACAKGAGGIGVLTGLAPGCGCRACPCACSLSSAGAPAACRRSRTPD